MGELAAWLAWFPRVGGDRPRREAAAKRCELVPPRGRG